jgi:POT family proton-dependent oligopeptide transporter
MSVAVDSTGASRGETPDTSGISGHPRGLTTLFFTEMWERFSFYGLRAILFLYMTSELSKGGLHFDQAYAGLIMATYASSVYWTPLIGGWLADKYLGARRAVFVGGVIIACGHLSMAFPTMPSFYAGLVLIAIGTGFLKPNVSTMVGDLYAEGDVRRDAGFSIFYMGINLGALLAPFVVGFLAQHEWFKRFLLSMRLDPLKSWHWGFGAACFFMILGLIQYSIGRDRLRGIGERPVKKERPDIAQVRKAGDEAAEGFDVLTAVLAVVGLVVGFFAGMKWGGAGWISGIFPGVVGFFFGYIGGTVRGLNRGEALRVGVIFILFIFSVVFWMSFEQAATSLTLFADRLTHLYVFGFQFPSSFYQSVQPIFVVMLAPVFALIWQRLGRRNPSSPAKFSFGLFFAALAFAIVALASTMVPATVGELTEAQKVGPLWLVAVYFFQTLGELCLSPVGLSTVTKLSPGRLVGLMMGVWFLSISIGNFVAGIMGGAFNEKAEGALVHLFGTVAVITIIAAVVLLALTPLIKKMTPRAA